MSLAKQRPRRIFYILTPVLSIVLTLFLIESVLRLFFPVPYSWETNMYFIADKHTGFRPKPNTVSQFRDGSPAVANSRGHRGKEISLEKQKTVFRILALGDSFTVGTNVREEQAYPQVLERLLTQQCQTRVEVINSGVGGWQPFHYAQYYEYYGRFLNPDLVLVGFFVGNDTYDQLADVKQSLTVVAGRRISRQAAASPSIGMRIWLYENSHLGRLVQTKTFTGVDLSRKDCADFSARYISVQTSRLANHLKRDQQRFNLAKNAVCQILRIKKRADSRHVPVIVALIPDENQINADLRRNILKAEESARYDFDMPQSMLIEMLEDTRVSMVIDLLPDFRKDSAECRYRNDAHWAPGGHALAARVICERIKPYVQVTRERMSD